MSFIDNLVRSNGYKNFMSKLYGWGAAVVIIGALFKINHWPGGTIMLIIGMGTETVIFFLSAFEPPHVEFDWTLVYPQLAGIGGGEGLNAKTEELENIDNLVALDNKDPLHNLRIMAVVEDAMAFSRALQITYSPSFHETEEHIFHPQYLRNYNGRPYVYGVYENEEENNGLPFVALPVDRIVTARLTKAVSYRPGDQQAYEAQLRNVLGASPNFRNPEVLEVVIRSHDQKVHKLLLSKPLHHSIREQQPCTAEQTGLLTMRVQMTQELYNWILYYGKGIEVVEPAELRKRITIGLSQMVTYYNAK